MIKTRSIEQSDRLLGGLALPQTHSRSVLKRKQELNVVLYFEGHPSLIQLIQWRLFCSLLDVVWSPYRLSVSHVSDGFL